MIFLFIFLLVILLISPTSSTDENFENLFLFCSYRPTFIDTSTNVRKCSRPIDFIDVIPLEACVGVEIGFGDSSNHSSYRFSFDVDTAIEINGGSYMKLDYFEDDAICDGVFTTYYVEVTTSPIFTPVCDPDLYEIGEDNEVMNETRLFKDVVKFQGLLNGMDLNCELLMESDLDDSDVSFELYYDEFCLETKEIVVVETNEYTEVVETRNPDDLEEEPVDTSHLFLSTNENEDSRLAFIKYRYCSLPPAECMHLYLSNGPVFYEPFVCNKDSSFIVSSVIGKPSESFRWFPGKIGLNRNNRRQVYLLYSLVGAVFFVCGVVLILFMTGLACQALFVCLQRNIGMKQTRGNKNLDTSLIDQNPLNLVCCCCRLPVRIMKSITFLLFLEFRQCFVLWLGISCFLVKPAVLSPSYIQSLVIFEHLNTCSVGFVLIYPFLDLLLISYYVGIHFISPTQFVIMYESYREWIYSRVLRFCFYTLFLVMGIFSLLVDTPTLKANFKNPMYIIRFASSILIYVCSIFQTVGYNGSGCYDYCAKLRSLGIRKKLRFPELRISLLHCIVSSPDKIISNSIFTISLVTKEKDVHEYQKLSSFSHLNWKFISGLSEKEILFLRKFFFDKSTKEKYHKILLYDVPTSRKWIQQFFFGGCNLFFGRKIKPSEQVLGCKDDKFSESADESEDDEEKMKNLVKEYVEHNTSIKDRDED